MPRPLTRAQALQNQAFLRALRRTGNAREAARAVGAHRATFTKRRARHPAFAQAWDAALAVAHAALGRRGPAVADEPHVLRAASGRLQLRAAQPGRLTRAAEQAFLLALSATANIRLSAKAAGFSHAAFYARRKTNAAFAREWRLALADGYARLEMALLESSLPRSYDDDAWRHNVPPALPPMTANQALQLLYLHQKGALMLDEPPHVKRRRGESQEMHSFRLAAMYEAGLARDREAFEVAEAARRERGEPGLREAWEATVNLPDLGQVTGWSNARPHADSDTARTGSAAEQDDRALFGGWRLDDAKRHRRPRG